MKKMESFRKPDQLKFFTQKLNPKPLDESKHAEFGSNPSQGPQKHLKIQVFKCHYRVTFECGQNAIHQRGFLVAFWCELL